MLDRSAVIDALGDEALAQRHELAAADGHREVHVPAALVANSFAPGDQMPRRVCDPHFSHTRSSWREITGHPKARR